MSRAEALDGVDLAEVLDMRFAEWERKTNKTAPWENKDILDRVAEILKHGANTENNSDAGHAKLPAGNEKGRRKRKEIQPAD